MSVATEPIPLSTEHATARGTRPALRASRHFWGRWCYLLPALLGPPSKRRLAQAILQIDRIRHWEKNLGRLSDEELKRFGQRLVGRARGGTSLHRLLPETFGAVCVAAQRTVGLRPYDVQLAAGVVLHRGGLAESVTGRGKTLVATMPVTLHALTGKGVHVTTVNDYLAQRDAEWTGPIYTALGLSVGVLQMKMEDAPRIAAYRRDITYGMASEFGFDFLRDRLKIKRRGCDVLRFSTPWTPEVRLEVPEETPVQRGHHFALVDEADNIFIDDARTPMVIGGHTQYLSPPEQVVYHWADEVACTLVRDQHFTHDEKKQKIELLKAGKQKARWSRPPTGPHSHAMDKLFEHVERALHARHRFRRDQHYMIDQDQKVVLIDESTGRAMPDRHWSDGLHQAVEARERVPITRPAEHEAQITFQSYFRLYDQLCGMTGTAAQNWWELRRVYKLWVVCVPTNRPVHREQWPDRIFPTEDAKFAAVRDEVLRVHAQGRPVLIGTRSVERSEQLSARLTAAGIAHQVLNARQNEQEAEIIAQAGQAGAVTIATNMAGRGTDIKLGPGVAEAGGLHVLATERHDALRIDRQLAGRAGRQGDPGTCQFFLSLEDELLEGLGPGRQEVLQRRGQQGREVDWQLYRWLFQRAQRRIERRHYRQRLDLLLYERQHREVLKELSADPYVE